MKDLIALFLDYWFISAALAAIVLIAYFNSKRKRNYSRIVGDNNSVTQNSK